VTDGGTRTTPAADDDGLLAGLGRDPTTDDGTGTAVSAAVVDLVGYRGLALAGALVFTFSYTSVLYHVTDVVETRGLALVVVAMLALGTLLGRAVSERLAVALTVALGAVGTVVYFSSIPQSQLALVTVGRLGSDVVALLTGLSVLRLTEAGTWAMAVAPAPVFLSWYLAVRGRYVGAVVAGGAALGFLVLTGDAGEVATLIGVVGATMTVGFGTLDEYGGTEAQVDAIAILVAAMIVLSATLSLVPAAAGEPLLPDRGTQTVEASLVSAEDRISVLGSIRLSPQVRFTVDSPEGRYWQTAAYDRYTSDGWVRTGNVEPYRGRLPSPPGSFRRVDQTVTAETPLDTMPAAWKPVAVSGEAAGSAQVSPQGGLRPGETVDAGDTYEVQSRVPQYTAEQLRRTGTSYPQEVRQYLQLPSSVSDRVRRASATVAGNETNPYDKAVAVERFLESEKQYSLTVERPDGGIADSFLFEMDAGYCTYYATTMVVMLRSQGVPARFVVGYTPGQEVDGDRYVVRGLDSHAWVQVYFPEVGWVNFDPTPGGPRRTAESARLTEARESGTSGVDTAGSSTGGVTETPTPTSLVNESELSSNATPDNPLASATPDGGGTNDSVPGNLGPNAGAAGGSTDSGGGFSLPEPPSREELGFMLVVLVGLAAGARRTGVSRAAADAIWLRVQPSGDDPAADVERAFARLEAILRRRHRPRRPGETPRAYLRDLADSTRGLDERARRVADAYERARYGDGVTPTEAAAVVATVDEMAWDETPLIGRLRN
jgi:transglutaminase-like putative cysteine protease